MLQEFISTVYALSIHGRWAELTEYLSLIRELLSRPQAVLTLGKPEDKPA